MGARTAPSSHPPGPRGLLGLGSLLPFHRDPNGFLLQLAGRYGDVSRFSVVGREFFFLNHPDLIHDLLVTHGASLRKGRLIQRAKRFLGEGLITSEEPLHREQRRKLQPSFDRDRLHRVGELTARVVARLLASWKEGDTLDVEREMRRVMLSIVASALFAADIEADAEELGAVLRTLERAYPLLMLPPCVERLPFGPLRRLRRARRVLDEIIYELIAARRRRAPGDDVIASLLRATSSDCAGYPVDRQIRDEVVTLFVAGHEITANMLCWALYLVSTHPGVERALVGELDRVLSGRAPDSNDLPRLPYVEMVLSETLRLYPPVGRLGRRSDGDLRVRAYVIPAGSVIFVSPYAAHRDRRYFPDPLHFDPERWTPEARAARPRFSYIPYGAGSRMCIGARFAQTVGTLVLATLLQRWKLVPVPGLHPTPRRILTMAPKREMPMVAWRRNPSPVEPRVA